MCLDANGASCVKVYSKCMMEKHHLSLSLLTLLQSKQRCVFFLLSLWCHEVILSTSYDITNVFLKDMFYFCFYKCASFLIPLESIHRAQNCIVSAL